MRCGRDDKKEVKLIEREGIGEVTDCMEQIKEQLGCIAYESGIKQIVDISSFTVTLHNNNGISLGHTLNHPKV